MPKILSLDVDLIKANLDTKRIGRQIIIYKSTASTNDVVHQYAAGGEKNHGLVVFAEHQTKGRGRRGNKWFDGKSKSILCSFLIFNESINPDMMVLAIAVAVARAIGKCGRNEPQIKWPNDIFMDDKKIAGILIEKKQGHYIVGIGINCHQEQTDFAGTLLSIATSVDIATGSICDRNLLAKRLILEIEHALQKAAKNPDEIVESWQSRSILTGKRITIEHNGNQFTGICLGVEPSQGLILHLELGGVKMFDAASTTIVK